MEFNFLNITAFKVFLGIEYKENLYNLREEFAQYFSTCIPNGLIINKEDLLKNSITDYLNRSDSQSSPGIYYFEVQKNRNKKMVVQDREVLKITKKQ